MNNVGYCGLICEECNEFVLNKCVGCASKNEHCGIKECLKSKDADHCFLCSEFPCDQGMFNSIRVRAFNRFMKDYGVDELLMSLKYNKSKGINYHNKDGSPGGYDLLKTEEEVISLLLEGMHVD